MIPKGTPVVAYDPDIQDYYNAIIVEDWDENGKMNPVVTIQTMIRYPNQTAIIYPDIPNENEPLLAGKRYRLKVHSIRATDKTPETYEGSVLRARMLAVEHAKQHGRDDCLEILQRHAQGKFRRRRSVLTVK